MNPLNNNSSKWQKIFGFLTAAQACNKWQRMSHPNESLINICKTIFDGISKHFLSSRTDENGSFIIAVWRDKPQDKQEFDK